jgi:hypothetical protein
MTFAEARAAHIAELEDLYEQLAEYLWDREVINESYAPLIITRKEIDEVIAKLLRLNTAEYEADINVVKKTNG